MGCALAPEAAAPAYAPAHAPATALATQAAPIAAKKKAAPPPAPSRPVGPGEISPELLAPPDLLGKIQPDWQWEQDAGQWRSYPLDESLELDRYWKVYSELKGDGERERLHLARVRLLKREGVVDFDTMTCQVEGSKARRLQRQTKEADWLNNSYFYQAFKAALFASGVEVESSADEMFDFRYNQDFRGMHDDGRPLRRGGQPYLLPIGWKRFAVHVLGFYDGGSNAWLKEDDSGWAVAYHGTSGESLPGILCSGFRVGSRQKFEREAGSGIYCTPFIDVAQHYSKPKMVQGHSVQIVLQLRVKPSAIRTINSATATEFEKKYWVINDPDDIRAYGVLIRELALEDYIPPEVMVYGKDWDKK